ncbi:hypothetical protein Ancab_038705 [Ancistrocladus abbreviatus]
MKNLLKKLNVASNQAEVKDRSYSSRNNKLGMGSTPRSQNHSEHKPFSALAGWFNSVTNRNSSNAPSSSNVRRQERLEQLESASTSGLDAELDAKRDSESSNSKDPELEEEYQIQLAMEMSAREDPEAAQIEAVKLISLGSCLAENAPAEVVAYRYWDEERGEKYVDELKMEVAKDRCLSTREEQVLTIKTKNYNALGYDDKILDGFYDLYGIVSGSTSSMPSLVDLQGTPVSEGISWEAILLNRAADSNLLKLEQKAMALAVKARSSLLSTGGELVQELANLVSDYMGGRVEDPDNMLRAWKSLSYSLRSTLGSMVLPLGSLTIGLARHRALLFKVIFKLLVIHDFQVSI